MLSQDFVHACKVYIFPIQLLSRALKQDKVCFYFAHTLLRHHTTCCKLFSCLPFSKVRKISEFPRVNIPQHMPRVTISYVLFTNIHWIIKRAWEFQKNIYFCFVDYVKAADCVDHNKLENSKRDGNARSPDLPPEKSICRSRSNS